MRRLHPCRIGAVATTLALTLTAVDAAVCLGLDGGLDGGFDGDGVLIENSVFEATALAVQTDGKILIAGSQPAGSGSDIYVARYQTTGAPDMSFGTDGKSVVSIESGSGTEFVTDMALDSLGRIIVVGYGSPGPSDDNDAVVVRFSSVGVAETPVVLALSADDEDVATGLAIGSGNSVIVGGYVALPFYDAFVVRLTNALAIDTSGFGGGDGIVYSGLAGHDFGRDIVVQSTGRVVVGGHGSGDSGTDSMLVGFTAAGAIDTNFGTTSGHTFTEVDVNWDKINALTLLDGDKILAVGQACTGATAPTCDTSVLRYLADGTLDPLFGTGGKKII